MAIHNNLFYRLPRKKFTHALFARNDKQNGKYPLFVILSEREVSQIQKEIFRYAQYDNEKVIFRAALKDNKKEFFARLKWQ